MKNFFQVLSIFLYWFLATSVAATPYTENVPAPTSLPLPTEYPAAGGVVIVLTGANGNVYYQFSDPTGAFRGFNNNGTPDEFEGNPFTVNDPISLDCGYSSCTDYFGGSIARMDVRFSAYDGDTQVGGFDEDDINLLVNGFDLGSWSGITTEITSTDGNTSLGTTIGFGNNTFNTAWFASTNSALLSNILTTGQTVSQVLDADPNDNYWDFRRGDTLGNAAIETIAPGYELEKTVDGDATTFAQVGEVITYNYVVSNIGSVDIDNISVEDDKIGTVACTPTTLERTSSGSAEPNQSFCTATYTVTQDDVDAQTLTNIALATGDPEFGTLGPLTDSVTLTGPALNPAMTLEKVATPTSFSTVGETITYDFTITNTGNATLSDVSVTDPRIPTLSCSTATLLPELAGTNVLTCSGTYQVTQDDVDDFINSGLTLDNTATLTADDPDGTALTPVMDTESLDGPAANPTFTITKTPTPTTYAADGETISYSFLITNTGNVTWPAPPTLVDALTGDEACPAGTVAPNGTVTCTATYDITLDDMDAGSVPNTVDASITVGGVNQTGQATAEVTAVIETELLIEKTLASGANPITVDTDELVYEYLLTNNSNVRLDTFAVTDDKVAVTCPVVVLDPGQTVTCTSVAYDVQQSDIDDGGVTNTASATAQTIPDVTVTSAEVELFVPATQISALTMSKASDPDPVPVSLFTPGAMVDYVYTVTNSGNVTVTDPVTVTDDKFANPIVCPAGPIMPLGSIECRATYEITAADVAAGTVVNTATASDGTTTSNSDSVAIPQDGAAGITLDKVADTADYDDLTDTIDYTFTVTNSGETTIVDLSPITINDPLLGTAFTCTEQPETLAPTESFSCTRTYGPVSQADIDAGQIDNTATASFEVGGVTYTSPSSSATVTSSVLPLFSMVKSGLGVDEGVSYDTLGEGIEYTFSVTNDGTQTLSSVVVTDPLIPGLSCLITDLAPGATDSSCVGLYTVDQDDLDDGSIFNEASALGTSPTGVTDTVTADTTLTIDPAAATYILDLEKSASLPAFAAVGDTINYGIEVSNIGNLTLENVVIDDPTLNLTCTIGTLAPLASDDSCVGSYVIAQSDIDAGVVFNEATASATGADDVSSDVSVPGPTRAPAFTVVKTPSADTDVAVDTVVTYEHLVTNTGNVTLTDITLTDTHTSASGTQSLAFDPSNVIASLAPGASVTVTTSYTITQDDIDAGDDVTNTVNATATPPVDTTVAPASGSAVVDLEDIAPAISVIKTETDGDAAFANLPTTEDFTFAVTNDGNVTLVGFVLTDDLTGFSCTLPDIAPLTSVTTCLDVSALSTTYTVDQDDIDTGGLTNTVTVTDGTTEATDSVTLAGPDQLPLLDMVKTATAGALFDTVGDQISYDYVVTNTGNITMNAPITVADDRTTVVCPAFSALAPTDSITCTATYTVDQDDLDAGSVVNLATATIRQPVVPSATHPTGTAEVSSAEETETVLATQLPAIVIAKAIEPGTASTYSAITDSVSFQFTVTNSGNVTLTDAITVTDLTIPTTLTCPAAGPVAVAPGASVTCTASWTPEQGDIDAGSFTNEATAATTFGGAAVATDLLDPATATATAIQTPAMEMVKALSGLEDGAGNPTTVFATGTVAVYSYTITNTGNTTLTSPITIDDNLIDTVTCPAGDLAPTDAPLVCSARYTITSENVELGSVTNIATATDMGGTQSPPTDETVPGDAEPSISMVKTADVATFSAVGDEIDYTYTVTNTSPGALVGGVLVRPALENPIIISDDKFPNDITCLPTADSRLSPDETTTCSATYLVTQADLDAVQGDGAGGLTSAFVTNNATAQTTYGSTAVVSPAQSVTVTGAAAPALSVTKDVTTGNDPASVDDELVYTITTTNTGNQRLSGITVTDPLIPAVSCTINGAAATSPFTLDAGLNGAGEVLICTGTYVVLQDDIDAQSLPNTATAEGSSPDGTVVTIAATDNHPLVTDSGTLTVLKELTTGDPATAYNDAGEEVSFTITVTNDRLVTLENIRVTDSRVDGTCVIPGPLAPGDSDTSCVFLYTILQSDIDAGSLTNVATAVGTPLTPGATDITGTDDLVIFGPNFTPMLTVAKTADVSDFTDAGDAIVYTYVISNTGNVTIQNQPALSDDKITDPEDFICEDIPAAGLAPTAFITCTATYTATQDDVDAGGVTNIATVTTPDTYNGGTVTTTDTETVPSVRTPAMTVAKAADIPTDVAAGDTITYTYTVTNTGNVTLEPITLSDSHTSAAGTSLLAIDNGGVIATLAPDAIATLEASYLVTQADIDSGAALTNTVTATPTPPTGTTLDPVTADETVTVEGADGSLEVLKTVSSAPDPVVPDVSVVTFQITVENDGNVSLTTPTLTDTLRRADTTLISPNPEPAYVSGDSATTGTVGTLDVGEIWVYTVSHTLTQDDIDAGGVANSVVAQATDPFGTQTTDTSDTGSGAGSTPTPFVIDAAPAVLGLKTITSSTVVVDETVVFEITVENTGNVTLNSVDVATDTLTRADTTPLALTTGPTFVSADMNSSAGTLLVGETATYRATYVLTQDDVDAGGILNTATVTGTGPGGTTVTDITDEDPNTGGDNDPTSLVIPAGPAISMVKSLFSGGPTYNAVDQELVFNFAVTNDGNITLTDPITITDAMITDAGQTITCEPTPLAPGDTLNCQGTYLATQNDIDTGEINNAATANSIQTTETETATVQVLAEQTPELTLVKASDPDPVLPGDFSAGAMVDYVYTVTNTGNVTITDAVTITDDRFVDVIACPLGDIAPEGEIICSATYEVTPEDVAAGSVTNTATASDGTTTSEEDSVTIPQDGAAGITLDKVADTTDFIDLTDTIDYTFTVTNTGETVIVNVTPVTITDPLLGEPFTCTEQPLNLFPTESFSCTRTYGPVTQQDIDDGEIVNVASASYTAGGETITSPDATATVTSSVLPLFSMVKSGLGVDEGVSYDTLGEGIEYTFSVTNDGTQTLSSVVVTDPLIPGLSCLITDLAPGATDSSCVGLYTVDQDDLDDGSIFNEASALGTSPTGVTDTVTADTTLTIDPAAATYILDLEKSASLPAFAAVGDTINYGIEVSNIGNLTLENVVIDDPTLNLTCTIGTLAPLASDDSCVGSYVIAQSDIDAGVVFNEATASATGADDVSSDVSVPGPTRAPAFTVVKTPSADTDVAVDTVVTYEHLVTNTGNVTLTDITLTDTHTSASGTQSLAFDPSNVIASLAPGASVTVTTSYTITQDDIDAGDDVTNTVNATATPPVDTTVAPASGSAVVDLEDIAPAISVIKTETDGDAAFANLPTTEDFTFAVTNDGNVTLVGFVLTDDLTGFSCTLPDIAPLTSVTTCLDVSALSTTYTVDQDDIDTGGLTNTVTVTDGTTEATDSVTLAGPDQLPLLDMVKTATAGALFDTVGDQISYDYVVTNTGNITMNAPITVADDRTTVVCPAFSALAPTDSITCTATYTVDQDDLDAGSVVNLATATIRQPVVPSATHPTGTAEVSSAEETETVLATQLPAIVIAKAIEPGTASTYSAITDSVSFQFTVTNSGNVTLTDAITVTDLTIPTTLTCPAAGPVAVAPGASVTCTASWTPEQGDIDAGSFTNEATAATTFGGAAVATDLLDPATATATAIQTPAMEMVKALSGLEDGAGNPTTVFATGTVAVYSYTITNTGNTTLTSPITIDDNLIDTVTCPAGDLAPTDAPLVCSARYTITSENVELGSVTNIATATDMGGTQSPPTDETVPGDAEPSISMVKTADVATFSAVGDEIDYTYTVTNTSPGALVGGVLVRPALENPIIISDDKFPNDITCLPTADSRLSPDETTTCSATYLVTQADLDAVQGDGAGGLTSAFVTNNATAQTTYGSTAVVSPAQSVTVTGAAAPALSVTKDVTTGNDPASVDDELVYTITTTNTGNQRLSGITVTDPLIPAVSCTINGAAATSPFTLDAGLNGAGEVLICTGTYVVLQDDIDAQSLPNTATAEGSSPDGTVVTIAATDNHPLVTDSGTLTVLKELTTGDPATAYNDAGEEVSFTITVTNDRLVTLENIRVTDSRVDGTCVIPGPLAPGDSDTSCVFLYTILQSDIDAGSLTNVATAVGTPLTPGATDITGTDDLVIFGPNFTPMLTVAKTADVSDFTDAGDAIVYTYVISNTGNVTIQNQPALSDDKITDPEDFICEDIPAAGLAPTAFITCTATYTATQDDVDAGGVTNIATVTTPDTYNGGTVTTTDTETVPSVRTPAMTVAKAADIPTDVAAGDTITYTYTVTNTGNVTLEPITLSDSHTSAAGTSLLAIDNGGVIATLAPDAIATLEASYLVTQADIDSGAALTNTVTATPTPPTGTTLDPVTADETVTVEGADGSLEVLKTVSSAPDPVVPDVSVVTFQITVENDGNVSLTTPTLTDTLRRADTTLISPNPEPAYVSGDSATTGTVGTLDVGEIWVYTVSHTLTQDDIDAGGVANSVVAQATDPFGTQTTDTSDTGSGAGSTPTPFVIDAAPAVLGLKTITSSTVVVDETVVFEITVENTGNVTLNSVDVATDTLTRADTTPLALTTGPTFVSADMNSSAGTLLVGETATYRATYVLTQDDVDAGGILNTATVTGTGPGGTTVTDITDEDPNTGGDNDPTSLVIPAGPAISMVKSLFSGGPTYNAVDQELVFNFAVTNDGNITLTDPITITDAMITDAGQTITCEPTPLAPGDTLNCQGTYLATQNDIDTGEINNAATANSIQTTETTPSIIRVPALQQPALIMTKVADDMTAQEFFVGAIASYTYTVTNVGNVTVTDPITITDNKISSADIDCPVFPTAGIAPNGTYVCTATYEVTVDDNSLRVVTNNATASDGNVTSPSVSETIPNDGIPALDTAKALFAVNGDEGRTTFDTVGDILTYEFTVTNAGTVSFSNDVNIIDPMIIENPLTCFTTTLGDPDLASGEAVTCQGTYAVTQDDLDSGQVFNEATAKTTFGVGPTEVESPAGSATTSAATTPALELVKSVATLPVVAVDQILTYTLTITNTGNQTLSNISANDPLLPNLVCEVDTLATGDALVCSDTYQVTQDDIDSETLVNTASVSAVNPQGSAVTNSTVLITDMPDAVPSFTVSKDARPDPFGAVGSAVLYTFTATNTGTVTLFDVTVTDDIVDPAYSCTIARLDVGANDNSCSLSYMVTQDDVDAGEIINIADATGTDP
ncbi:MAG: beta strand repeat-containing protein, partial [Octadecabacter sp.]